MTGQKRVIKLLNLITELTTALINGKSYKERSRKTSKDFTRNRKMAFEEVVLFMLTSMKCSTQTALRRFFTAIGQRITIRQQSYSEARAKINVSAFVELFKLTVTAMTENINVTWNG